MRVKVYATHVTLELTAFETTAWAQTSKFTNPTVTGRSLYAVFDKNGLVEVLIDGRPNISVAIGEFSAICAEHLAAHVSASHPARFIAVDQFLLQGDPRRLLKSLPITQSNQ